MSALRIRRFLPRFSLRTLVIFLLLVTSGMGLWWHWEAWWLEERAELPDYTSVFLSASGERAIGIVGSYEIAVHDARTWARVGGLKDCRRLICPGRGSPRGWRVLVDSQPYPGIWDAERLRILVNLRPKRDDPPFACVQTVCYSPDDSRIITTYGPYMPYDELPYPRIWDARTGQRIGLLGADNMPSHLSERQPKGGPGVPEEYAGRFVQCACWAPDGSKLLTTTMRGSVCWVWGARTLEPLIALRGHAGWLAGASFSPDSRTVVTSGGSPSLCLWDAKTGRQIGSLDGSLFRAFSPDGAKILTVSPVRVLDARTGAVLGKLDKRHRATFISEGRVLTLGDPLRIWSADTGALLAEAPVPRTGRPAGKRGWSCSHAALAASSAEYDVFSSSPDGTRLVYHEGYTKRPDGTGSEFSPVCLYRRRRPEWWWGVFWLWEFWLTVVFAGVFVWSVVRDRRSFAAEPDPGGPAGRLSVGPRA